MAVEGRRNAREGSGRERGVGEREGGGVEEGGREGPCNQQTEAPEGLAGNRDEGSQPMGLVGAWVLGTWSGVRESAAAASLR